MRLRRRTEYHGSRYPSREAFTNRRGFLLGVGKLTVVAAVGVAFGRRVRADEVGGGPRITELPDGTFQIEMPGAPSYLLASGNRGGTYRYRVIVVVASVAITTFVEENDSILYDVLNDGIGPYDFDDLEVTATRTEAEGVLLQALRDTHCDMTNCTAGDFLSLILTTSPYYDNTVGCSCGSVPW